MLLGNCPASPKAPTFGALLQAIRGFMRFLQPLYHCN